MHQHIFNFVKLNKGNQREKFSNGLQLRPQHGLQKEELIHLRANFGCSGTFGNASLRDCSISCLTESEKQRVFSCPAGGASTKAGSDYSSGLPVHACWFLSRQNTTARNNLQLGKQTQIALQMFFTCFVQTGISTREDTTSQIYKL